MPVVNPAELWQETGRWYQVGEEMGRFEDRSGRDMVLAMTHEEVVADLVRKEIRSYRQLPLLLYHIQTKWRDDPRPRGGLIRVREFTMKDSYSLDTDWEGLDQQYRAHYQAYFNIFRRCGIDAIAVKSDVGMMGGQLAHEFIYLTPVGEDTIIICPDCGYAANRQIARFKKSPLPEEKLHPIEKIATPGCKTIEDLANYLEIPKAKTAKAVFVIATMPEGEHKTEQFVFAVLRGDMELNETKLANAIHATELRPATEQEIQAVGAVPGYASPLGLENVLVVVDDLIPESPNLVAGANEEGYHLRNVNYGRDFEALNVNDIAAAQYGDQCPVCAGPLEGQRGVEIGNIFKLGTRYSEALGATFQDAEGKLHPVVMGSYGIGSGRLLACIAEEHHDEHGLILPISIAPYQVHLIVLKGKEKPGQLEKKGIPNEEEIPEKVIMSSWDTAEKLYVDLQQAGIEVLYDDRNESPGVKFKDADLIGVPIRLTASQWALQQGGVEFKRRNQQEKRILSLKNVIDDVCTEIQHLQSTIDQAIVPVPYPE